MATSRATTLEDALDVLDVLPLEFGGEPPSPATDPAFYTEPPPRDQDGLAGPGPIESIRDQLLTQARQIKVFLSGHVGSGKSTQLSRLAADPELQRTFTVVPFRIEAQLVPFLDTAQLLFLMAAAIFERGIKEDLLGEDGRWRTILRELDARIFGESGLVAKEGAVALELNLLFVKLREELKVSERRRKQFRDLGETQQTLLQDLLRELTLDVEQELVKKTSHRSLLLIIDDLDKVRRSEQQKDIFDTNLASLFMLPFRVLYTVPTGVVFGPNRAEVRQCMEHLYPVRVIDKAPSTFDPERAYIPEADTFFREALHQRVDPALFEGDVIRLAAIHSGGVLREFFRLLRSGVRVARYNKLDVVDVRALRGAIRDERLRESAGLLGPDYEALAKIHETHGLQSDAERRYLDESRVLECYNDKVWYEVNPLLWPLLESR